MTILGLSIEDWAGGVVIISTVLGTSFKLYGSKVAMESDIKDMKARIEKLEEK